MNINFTQIIDISWPLSPEMTAYKDKKIVEFTQTKIFERDKVRESKILLGSHSGTHIDAPNHFLDHGQSIDSLELKKLMGPCKVLDFTHITEKITESDLAACDISEGDILLFKTKNSQLEPNAPFDYNFIYLDKSGAEFLASKKIRVFGLDYLGIERNQPGHETHTALFEAGVTVIEGLRLKDAAPGNYFFVCLPLRVTGLEAAPARAVLLRS